MYMYPICMYNNNIIMQKCLHNSFRVNEIKDLSAQWRN